MPFQKYLFLAFILIVNKAFAELEFTIAAISQKSTEALGEFATQLIWATEQAVHDLNNLTDPIIPNVKFNFQHKDSYLSKKESIKAVRDLMTQPNQTTSPIIGIVGEIFSSISGVISLSSQVYKVMQCSGASSSPDLSDKDSYSNFFRTVPSDVHHLGQVLQTETKRLNITIKARYSYSETGSDMNNCVKTVQVSGAKVIVILGYIGDVILFFKEARKLNMINKNYVYIGSDGTSIDSLANLDLKDFDGYFYLSPKTYANNDFYRNLKQNFLDSSKNQSSNGTLDESSFIDRTGLYYDCVFSLVHAFKNLRDMESLSLDTFSSSDLNSPKINLTHVERVNFTGVSGDITFDKFGDPRSVPYLVTNIQDNQKLVIGFIDGKSGIFTQNENFIPKFNENSTIIPFDSNGELKVKWNDPGPLVVLSIYIMGFCLTVVSTFILYIKRSYSAVKCLQASFLQLISLGLLMIWSSILGFVFESTAFTCSYQQWSLYVGIGTILGAVLVKVFRIWQIFANTVCVKANNGYLRNGVVLLYAGLIILGEVIILSTFTVIDPPLPTKVETLSYFYYECLSHNSETQITFNIILLGYNATLLLMVTVLAYKTRNVRMIYRESSYIAQMSLNIALCAMITNSKTYHKLVCLIGPVVLSLLLESYATKVDDSKTKSHVLSSNIDDDNSLESAATNRYQSSARGNNQENHKKTSFMLATKNLKHFVLSNWKKSLVIIKKRFLLIYMLNEVKKSNNSKFEPSSEGICIIIAEMNIKRNELPYCLNVFTEKISILIQCKDDKECDLVFYSLEKNGASVKP
ncbi:Gamma-aminobutyric acid type B receptor subunit 2 [Clydaea vesicula]|uniref:Gamma-aminobutyric acid type B receptor subunit 2 n=1 Tax=Clydaea vesicula TaxID=447962 RepID=A0AAD5Y1W3_9FUNG|nr:Gamma-aminobutyric acid type B receptor subunit 2 [Clydaea vesicula]